MKISALNNVSNVRNYATVKNNQQQKPTKNTEVQNKDLLAYPKNYRPSFGFGELVVYYLVLGGIIGAIAAKSAYDTHLDKKYDQERNNEIKKVAEELKNDINKLAEENHLTFEEAKIYHDNYLKTAMIKPNGDGNEIGLNAVMGYAPTKYKLAVDFITPLVAKEKGLEFKDKSVPNGMLLYGPHGSGKTYMADKTCEHLKHFGVNVIDITLDDVNHDKNEEMIYEAFEQGKKHYKETGKYTVINFTKDFDEFFINRKKSLETIHEVRMFLACADNCRDEGVTWIGTANNPQEIDSAVMLSGRTDIKLPVGNMKNFSAADMLKYTLLKNGELEAAKKIDYELVVDVMEVDLLAFTPAEYDDIVKTVIRNKYRPEELITADMILDEMFERTENNRQYLNSQTNAKFSEDVLYIEDIDKNTESNVNLLSQTTPRSFEEDAAEKIKDEYPARKTYVYDHSDDDSYNLY